VKDKWKRIVDFMESNPRMLMSMLPVGDSTLGMIEKETQKNRSVS
jgi:hypothetical protein